MSVLREFTNEDYATLYKFMRPLWLETYSFLPLEQVEFLLNKYFSETGLRHYRELGYRYYKIETGVLVIHEKQGEIYIDKLYLPPSARGTGLPKKVFAELLQAGKDLTLNVNKENQRAIRCYLKNGFKIERETEIPLNCGFINHDYEMRLYAKKPTD